MTSFTGTAGNDTITGTSADDTITGQAGDDVLFALAGNDRLYGGDGHDVLNAGDGNDLLDGGVGADTMRGGVGDDRFYVDNVSDVVMENAGEGNDTVYSSITYRLRANVENLNLTGSAVRGLGNDLSNRIVGNAGNNILDGMAGADVMRGGLGNDSYYVDNAGDRAIENSGEGTDTVFSSITYRLRENVENLNLLGSAVRGLGNSVNNRIVGNSGNNILDGLAGADVMRGGLGNDSYYVDNAGDRAIENSGEGTDTVYSSIDFVLGANVENLTLTGLASIDASGNGLDNRLVGNAGDNFLDGLAGADTMRGGAGHDSYYVDNVGDRVIENAGEGSDTVYSSINYALGSNVENLTLTGSAISGTGNSLDNFLTGNAQDNVLAGNGGNDVIDGGSAAGYDTLFGGAGNDTLRSDGVTFMTGGTGDDVYYIDDVNDIVTESSGEGTDTQLMVVDGTLFENVENGIMQDTGAVVLHGNVLDNTLTANDAGDSLWGDDGNDTLIGGSGDDSLIGEGGDDVMSGGTGDDGYYVDSAGDVVTELAGEGSDTVLFFLDTYTLGSEVENGYILAGTGATLTGNGLANILVGGDGADQLVGLGGNDTIDGGAGADTMTGGTGDDTYFVDSLTDVVSENVGEGTELVWVAVATFNGAENVENVSVSPDFVGGVTMSGNTIANLLTGGVGNDTFFASYGADTIVGGQGDDTLFGEQGADVLTGGAGADVFRFNSEQSSSLLWGIDTVTDFVSADDTLDFRGVSGLVRFTGASASAHSIWIYSITANPDGGYDYVFRADTDGVLFQPDQYEMEIHVHADTLASSDFLFG